MADNRQMLNELKKRLEGKTVVRIDPPGHSEAIGHFLLSDGTAFRLCATDLGFWIEDIPGEDGFHVTLTSMLEEYYHHLYRSGLDSDSEPKVVTEGQNLSVIAQDGSTFRLPMSRLTKGESDLFLASQEHLNRLASLAPLGSAWRVGLSLEERNLVPLSTAE